MNISESYFQRLLHETEAIEAIHILSGFWASRLGENAGSLNVTKTEWTAQLIMIYSGEIMNGGHVQYFLNRNKTYLIPTVLALMELSIISCARALLSASEIVGDNMTLSGLSTDDLGELSRLDREVTEHLYDVDTLLLRYLKENEENLLIPERGK